MAKIPYIPLYIGDWEQDTNCLSLQAEAAWLKIIFKMHKDDKSGIYKTSTKSLQNLWKTDTNGVQEILNELIENNVCGLEIGETIIFSNRRMIREREISEIRSKSVQKRYKTPTKDGTKGIQNTDIDNDIDNDNKGDSFGKSENLLTDAEVNNTIEYVHITGQIKLNAEQVRTYWAAYLIHAEGQFYNKRSDKIQHFRNWLKKQPHETTQRRTSKDSARPNSTITPV